MKKIALTILSSFMILLSAGQDLNINHYPFYRDGLNPGSFVHAPEINVMLLYNNEYWGFSHEPNTQMVDVSLTLGQDMENKLGLMVYNDVIGFDKAQNFKLRYARKFNFSKENHSFSLGLSTGAIHKRIQANQMVFEAPDDPLSLNEYNHTLFDFDFGAEFQLDKLTLGLATNHLGKPFTEFDDFNPTPHYYGYAEYTTSGEPFQFRPNVIFRYWKNTYWVEAGLIAFYHDQFWLGGTYTDFHDMTFMAGLILFKQQNYNLHLGYAFKSNLNKNILKSISPNSHEIFLNFSFGEGGQWPAYPPSVRNMEKKEKKK